MIKVEQILEVKPFYIICKFNTGEVKKFTLGETALIVNENRFHKKLSSADVFKQVKIGEFGQLYWEGIAEMKDENGKTFVCEYDMSPEYIYHHSSTYN
jgi:hypothetical protein